MRLEQSPVCGDKAAAGERYDVAGHDLRHRHVPQCTIAQHAGADLDRLPQSLCSAPGAVFLDEVEGNAQQYHDDDDDEARDFAAQRGDEARRDQDQNHRIAEAAEKRYPSGARGPVEERVHAIALEPPARFGLGKAGTFRAHFVEQRGNWQ